jgi:Right handed beta helix region
VSEDLRRSARSIVLLAVVGVLAVGAASDASGFPPQHAQRPATKLGSALPGRMPLSRGKTFYVDGMYGRDGARGTRRRPWRTIQYALDHVPLAGGIVVVRAGTYAGEIAWHRNADPRNPVTLRAYSGERVTLTGKDGVEVPAIWISRGGGIRIRGFDIGARWGDGIRIENSHDVEVVGCDVHDSGQIGILVVGTGSVAPTGNRDIQLWANRFYDNGGAYIAKNPFWIRGDHAVYWGAVSNNADGIDHSTVGGVIANNRFLNQPYGRELQLGSQVNGAIVTNNTFRRAYQSDRLAGDAVVFYAEDNEFATHGVLFVNNIIADNAHNGIDGSGGSERMLTNLVDNNLAWNNPDGDFETTYAGRPLYTLGPRNVVGKDPLFVAADTGNLHLRVGSPARGRSLPEYTPPIDALGRQRKIHPDLGALESFGSRSPARASRTRVVPQ